MRGAGAFENEICGKLANADEQLNTGSGEAPDLYGADLGGVARGYCEKGTNSETVDELSC